MQEVLCLQSELFGISEQLNQKEKFFEVNNNRSMQYSEMGYCDFVLYKIKNRTNILDGVDFRLKIGYNQSESEE